LINFVFLTIIIDLDTILSFIHWFIYLNLFLYHVWHSFFNFLWSISDPFDFLLIFNRFWLFDFRNFSILVLFVMIFLCIILNKSVLLNLSIFKVMNSVFFAIAMTILNNCIFLSLLNFLLYLVWHYWLYWLGQMSRLNDWLFPFNL